MKNQNRNDEQKKPKPLPDDEVKSDNPDDKAGQADPDLNEESDEDKKEKHRTPLSSDNNYGNIGITGGVEDLDEDPNYYDTDEDESEE